MEIVLNAVGLFLLVMVLLLSFVDAISSALSKQRFRLHLKVLKIILATIAVVVYSILPNTLVAFVLAAVVLINIAFLFKSPNTKKGKGKKKD